MTTMDPVMDPVLDPAIARAIQGWKIKSATDFNAYDQIWFVKGPSPTAQSLIKAGLDFTEELNACRDWLAGVKEDYLDNQKPLEEFDEYVQKLVDENAGGVKHQRDCTTMGEKMERGYLRSIVKLKAAKAELKKASEAHAANQELLEANKAASLLVE